MMSVEVLLFANLRELAGQRTLAVDVPAGSRARDVWRAAIATVPRLDGADSGVRVAVNEVYASWDTAVSDGDAVAFIPPVAGGVDHRVHVRLTTDVLDARALESMVRTDADGAVCTFSGVVRDNAEGRAVTRLEYEAYPGMTEAELRRIGADALQRFAVTAIAIEHRTGTLEVGEASVVVCASAAHRAPAFDACRWAMDTLKVEAPIWKKEHGEGGAVWVDETARGH